MLLYKRSSSHGVPTYFENLWFYKLLLRNTLIAAEALTNLTDQLVITNLCARDMSNEFNNTPNGYKVGDTVRIKVGTDYTVNEFTSTITAQSIRESHHNLAIEKLFDVSVSIGAREKALKLSSFVEQVS